MVDAIHDCLILHERIEMTQFHPILFEYKIATQPLRQKVVERHDQLRYLLQDQRLPREAAA